MGMNLSTDDLTVAWTTPVVGLLLGVVVTVLAAYVPARRAGKVSPMAALRDAGTPADGKAGVVGPSIGLVLTGAGGCGLYLAPRRRQGERRLDVAGRGRGPDPHRLRRHRPAARRRAWCGCSARWSCGSSARSAGWPSATRCATRAVRAPRGAALMIGLALVACLSVVGSSMVASATERARQVGRRGLHRPVRHRPADHAAGRGGRWSSRRASTTSPSTSGLEAKLTTPDGKTRGRRRHRRRPDVRQGPAPREVVGGQAGGRLRQGRDVGRRRTTPRTHGVKVGDEDRPSPSRTARRPS